MTNKFAFIFDMDGVLIDSETTWAIHEQIFFRNLVGNKIYNQVKDQMHGTAITSMYDIVHSLGLKISRESYLEAYDLEAKSIYQESALPEGIINLMKNLRSLDIKIGLVSSSRRNWINQTLSRIGITDYFSHITSLIDSPGMEPKPSPQGYILSMKELGVLPSHTFILEDSNGGLTSAKASGAHTLWLKQFTTQEFVLKTQPEYVIESIQELSTNIGKIIAEHSS